MEPPADQKDIIDMLVQPQTFGQGLFDYSCHGNNWVISDKLVSVYTGKRDAYISTEQLLIRFQLILIFYLPIARASIPYQFQSQRND